MGSSDADPTASGDLEQELRTLSVRMREIQRLLNMCVEQENQRLEVEGIDPVPKRSFHPDESDQGADKQ
jgi:hypothetical protein